MGLSGLSRNENTSRVILIFSERASGELAKNRFYTTRVLILWKTMKTPLFELFITRSMQIQSHQKQKSVHVAAI